MATRFLFLLPLLFLFACQSTSSSKDTPEEKVDHLQALAFFMSGSFDSHEQAEADTNYFNISLHMVPIWEERAGEHWMYVEQALAARQEAPYRQRVYQLSQGEGDTLSSAVFTLPDPESVIGAWQTPAVFDSLSPEDLILREGCAVYLIPQEDGSYAGSTYPNTCGSTLRGAAYATSSVTVFPGEIVSWDQGFDSTGTQVWGAEDGGYRFVKR
ncbi:MAG: chromophore lyase CpcT/CpeT [Bacteroidota bacterium]